MPRKLTTEEFIQKAKNKHGNKYDYSITIYNGTDIKTKIICPVHGTFEQTPGSHLRNTGNGCPSCSHTTSKAERQWLSFINIPDNKEHRQVNLTMHTGKKRSVDGFDPKTNTVYEFHGDFWHGNPAIYNPTDINKATKKTFGELYESTLHKEALIKKSGYSLVVMWENDWNKKGVKLSWRLTRQLLRWFTSEGLKLV